MARKSAFTLAEVLITLGIIGVVAAMTLPTLLNSTQASQFRAQFKKTLSVASQAVVVTVALDDYDMGQANSTETGLDDNDEYYPSLYNMFDRRLNVVGHGGDDGYAASWTVSSGVDETDPIDMTGTTYNIFYLNDGSTLGIPADAQQCTAEAPCEGFIDVNGPKMPNVMISCQDKNSTGDDDCKADRAGDVYPIELADQTITPASAAARWVLYKGGK